MIQPRRRTSRQILRDYMIYVAISVALVLGLTLWAVYVPEKYDVDARWVGLAFTTAVIFGGAFHSSKALLRRPIYWVAIAAVVLAHLTFWIVLLKRWEIFRLAWFTLLMPPELMVIAYLLGWCEIATEGFKRLPRFAATLPRE